MTKYQKTYRSKIFVFLLVFAVLFACIPVIVGATEGTDPNFTIGPSSFVLDVNLVGSSTNDHTIPERIWTNGNTVYAAVRSTHEITDMTIGAVASYDFLEFDYHQSIFVDGVELDPLMEPVVNGTVNWAHWTVFKFNVSELVSSGTGNYPITITSTEVGGGHELGTAIQIIIPQVTATVTKTWIGGPMNPISIQLYKESITTPKQVHGDLIQLTAVNGQASYTWDSLPYTDDFGNKLIYSIEEPSGGSGYTVDFTDNSFTPIISDLAIMGSYDWELTNTYTTSGTLDLSGTKTLNGRALAADEFDFELYEVEDEIETLIETVSNLADGSYSFSSLDFGLADIDTTKTYKVVEKQGTLSNVTYDDTEYTLTVDITDNGAGTLDIDVTGADPDALDFTNTFTTPPTIVVTTESIPLVEPTTTPSTIIVEPEDIPKTGESAPLWPIGLVLLALAGGLGFIVHRSDSRKVQKEKSKR